MPSSILSVERFLPPYRYPQSVVTGWVREWLHENGAADAARLLSVYATAGVETRASVVPIEDVFFPGDFETQNDRFGQHARAIAEDLARRALASAGLEPGQVDLVVSVSCTGFMIPAMDAHVADALGLGPRLVRLPITESGCAGGVVGLARANDYLTAHPERAALVIAVELSSLTFQRWDRSATNVVSTAIFGDGGAAVVLVGDRHPAASRARVTIADTESVFFRGTTHLMGFRLRNQGLQIVLDRGLAPFVRREVLAVVEDFLHSRSLAREAVTRWILHPGGRRIIEVMSERLGLAPGDLAPTEAVLSEHGNMSSVTVLFVLDEILRAHRPAAGERGVMGAFGPGFGAEFALLEFR
ncbi:MAG: 3-oxoacyl-[acyl-carrier-protein] synthase III C-terminal domain-containing protein [Vicinamibacteria bacterium]